MDMASVKNGVQLPEVRYKQTSNSMTTSSNSNSVNELLAITSNAVKSLAVSKSAEHNGNPSNNGSVHHETASSVSIEDVYGQEFHETGDTVYNDSREIDRQRQTGVFNNLNDTGNSRKNQSLNSTLLSGNAQKVRMSAKKLREIQSPFGTQESLQPFTFSDPGIDRELPSPRVFHSDPENIFESDKFRKCQPVVLNTDVTKDKLNDRSIVVIERHSGEAEHETGAVVKDTSSKLRSKNVVTDRARTGSVVDSGFVTQKTKDSQYDVTKDVHNATHEDAPSITDEDILPQEPSIHSHGSQETHGSSCTQPEIYTVEEKVITVCASNDVSSNESSIASSAAGLAKKVKDRFGKFPLHTLKQGALVDNSGGSANSLIQKSGTGNDEVHIVSNKMSDRQKMVRKNLAQRGHSGAVKKPVQAKIITTTTKQPPSKTAEENKPSLDEVVQTAAMAAASAVAATQPFLKAQQDMELKMAEILERINKEGSKSTQSNEEQEKIAKLERQVEEMTQKRLEHLEQMQQNQFSMQAQLLSISRDKRDASPSREKKSSPRYVRVTTPNDEEKEKSILDTPAPRRRPPQPTSFDTSTERVQHSTPEKKPRKGGLLAEILASQEETPKSSPFRPTPEAHRNAQYRVDPGGVEALKTAQRAGHLVDELEHLKDHLANAVQQKPHVRTEPLYYPPTKIESEWGPIGDGPAPLDEYLVKPKKDAAPRSPYHSKRDFRSEVGNAPVVAKYADAMETLRNVQKSRDCLEQNLDTILRSRGDGEIYQFLQDITQNSSNVEQLRLRKMVDKYIASMNTDLEREIFDELLKIDEKKQLDKARMNAIMIPERDTNKGQVKVTGRGRGGIQSRIDTGLRKPGVKKDPIDHLGLFGKENKPKTVIKKPKALDKNPKYLERVYGKALANQRLTQKEPYLRYQSDAAKKPVKKIPEEKIVKGKEMATAKTQTKKSSVPAAAAQQYLTQSDAHLKQAGFQAPTPGNLMPMAIPLGAPRKLGNIPLPPETFTPSPHHPLITSTPIYGTPAPGGNIARIEEEDLVLSREEREVVELKEPPQKKAHFEDKSLSHTNRMTQMPNKTNQMTQFTSKNGKINQVPSRENQSSQIPSQGHQINQVPSRENQLAQAPSRENQGTQVPSKVSQLVQVPSGQNQLVQVPSRENQLTQVPSRENQLVQVPSKTSQITQHPSQTDQIAQHPSMIDRMGQYPTKMDQMAQYPNVTDQIGQFPSKTDQMAQYPSKTDQLAQYPSKTDQLVQNPSRTDQLAQHPSRTDQLGQYPSRTDQLSQYPSKADQLGQYPSKTDQLGQYPSKTDQFGQYPSRTDQFGQYPSKTDQLGQYPSRTDQSGQYPSRGHQNLQYPNSIDQSGQFPSRTDQTVQNPNTADQLGQYPSRTDQMGQYPNTTDQMAQYPNNLDQFGQYPSRTDQIGQYPNKIDQTSQYPNSINQFGQNPSRTDQFGQYPSTANHMAQHPSKTGQMVQVPGYSNQMNQIPSRTNQMKQARSTRSFGAQLTSRSSSRQRDVISPILTDGHPRSGSISPTRASSSHRSRSSPVIPTTRSTTSKSRSPSKSPSRTKSTSSKQRPSTEISESQNVSTILDNYAMCKKTSALADLIHDYKKSSGQSLQAGVPPNDAIEIVGQSSESEVTNETATDESTTDNYEDDFTTEGEEEDAFAIPGHKPPQTRYDGPQFPPSGMQPKQPTTSEQIAEDLVKRDAVSNQAMEWVEQELMARIISEMYLKREAQGEAIPHTASRAPPAGKSSADQDSLASSVSELSQHDSFIAEAVGQDGLQLFVDTGAPVDDNLVQELVKEVIMEKISHVIGQRTTEDDYEEPLPPPDVKTKKHKSKTSYSVGIKTVSTGKEKPFMIPTSPVSTPEVTPRHSPIYSPVHSPTRSPLQERHSVATPEVTPATSCADEVPQYKRAMYYDEDDDTSRDEPLGEWPEIRKKEVSPPVSFAPRTDIPTPEATPPPTPPLISRTPTPSVIEEPPPSPSREPTPPPVEAPPTLVPDRQVTPPPQSPKPWDDTKMPLPEENPNMFPESSNMEMPAEIEEDSNKVDMTPPLPPRLPRDSRRRTPSPSTESIESTEISETINECISEGQWLLSVHSEGEVEAGPKLDPEMAGRFRNQLFLGKRYEDDDRSNDTLGDTEDIDRDLDGRSEGEVLHPRGFRPESDPALALLAHFKPPVPGEYVLPPNPNRELGIGVDRSLGEVSFGQRPRMGSDVERIFAESGDQRQNGSSRNGSQRKNGNNGMNRGAAPKDERPQRPIFQVKPKAEEDIIEESPPGVRTITVKTSTSFDFESEGQGESKDKKGSVGQGRPRPTMGHISSTLPSKSQGRRFKGGTGGKADKFEPRQLDETELRESFGMSTYTSDLESRTMTPDQMNIDNILASRDYLNTKSDINSSVEFNQSGRRVDTSADFNQSGGQIVYNSTEFNQSGKRLQKSVEFAQSDRLVQTFGSTSDMSLADGLVDTLERSGQIRESEKLTYTVESDSELNHRYPDSLEGTGETGRSGVRTGTLGSTGGMTGESYSEVEQRKMLTRTGPLQLSFTIPSANDEHDTESVDDDLSEYQA